MGVFSLTGWSRRIRAGFLVSRVTQDTTRPPQASDTGLSPSTDELSRSFSSPSAYHGVVLLPQRCIATTLVWAGPRSLATTRGIIVYFLFLRVLRCFSSLRWRRATARHRARSPMGCPIRKSPDQWSFAPTRGLSQLITSFIASESQGIHLAPFPTFFYQKIGDFTSTLPR